MHLTDASGAYGSLWPLRVMLLSGHMLPWGQISGQISYYISKQTAAADLGADAIIVQGASPTIKTEGGVTVVQTHSVKT